VVIPLAVAAMGLAVPALPESADPHGRDFDAPAQMLGAVVLGGLALAAIEVRNTLVLAGMAFAIACAALPLFCLIESRRGPASLLPLEVFGIPAFRAAITATAAMTFGMYGVLFLQPLLWQSGGTLTPFEAGIALVPMAAVFALVSPFSGTLSARMGDRAMTSGGVGLIGGGLMVLAASAGAASLAPTELGLVLAGLGMGLASGPLFGTAVGSVPAARAGTAAALINVARMVGATLGVAILGSAFAVVGGGAGGLRLAMLLGGLTQFASAGSAWREQRPRG
jgi:MFS transporter, DHA2 family, methylenomycin A resistance protein